ncbi:MAG: Mu transposase C-terminal domain-containing protein [Brevinema sp.]
MREKYYTAKDLASFLGISLRSIQRISKDEAWDHKIVKKNGANEKRYAFSLLPAAIQTKILSFQQTDLSLLEDTPMNRLSLAPYNRRIAEARLAAIELFKKFHEEHGGRKDKNLDLFITQWKSIASAQTLEILPQIKKRTFYHWQSLLSKGGIVALAPEYGKRQGITKLPKQYHNLVLTAYLDQNQRSARSIHGHIIHQVALTELGDEAWDLKALANKKRELSNILTEFVVQNFIKNQTSKGLLSATRGQRSEQDRILGHIARDRSSLNSNQIWVSDGHDANTFVIGEGNKPVRPVIVAWMDEKSRMIMGFSIDITENTDLIVDSLANAVESYGIPEEVYIDNGKAYINKRTTSEEDEKFLVEKRFTTYQMLGCTVRRSRPYNGREKSIERFWGRLDNDFSKYLKGYAGKDILSKPKKTELEIKSGRLISIEEYREFLQNWIVKYNSDPHTGEGMDGRSPYEVYQENLDPSKVRYADKELIAQMRLVYMNDLRSITAGGKIRARNITYIAPELIAHIGDKVKVGLDPHNLDRAYIFLNDQLLCIAENEIRADYDPNSPKTQKAFRQQAKTKGAVKKLNKKITEIKKANSAILLAEKTKVLDSKPELITKEKEEVFDRYDY